MRRARTWARISSGEARWRSGMEIELVAAANLEELEADARMPKG